MKWPKVSRYSNKCFWEKCIIFDLISALKSSSFKENTIIFVPFRSFTFWSTSKRLLKQFFVEAATAIYLHKVIYCTKLEISLLVTAQPTKKFNKSLALFSFALFWLQCYCFLQNIPPHLNLSVPSRTPTCGKIICSNNFLTSVGRRLV